MLIFYTTFLNKEKSTQTEILFEYSVMHSVYTTRFWMHFANIIEYNRSFQSHTHTHTNYNLND